MYARTVIKTPDGSLRERLYGAYASQHASCSDSESAALIYRRDIRPALLSPAAGSVLDIGCGQGELVKLMLADGYDAMGIDVSQEQVAVARTGGLDRIQYGDYRDLLDARTGQLAAVTATDVVEHLTKTEVLETFDRVMSALAPGGIFVARVPNAASPFGGHIRYGDFTHESSHTARSVRQIAAAAGFAAVAVRPCPPVAHGLPSTIRAVAWKAISAWCKTALAAETGMLRGHIVTQNLTFVARKGR